MTSTERPRFKRDDLSPYCAICRKLALHHGDHQECPDTWIYRDGEILTTEELAQNPAAVA